MTIKVPADQTSLRIPGLEPGRRYRFGVRGINPAGPGQATISNEVVPESRYGKVPSPWEVPEPQPGFGSLPMRGSFNGWDFGVGSSWPIERSDGIFDMMALKTQDSQLVGDGEVFGWDSEEKRVITIEFSAGLAELAGRCGNGNGGGFIRDPLLAPRCAMMRRHDELPLRLDDWIIMARPRRFLAPQRRSEPTVLIAGWEAPDPAIYAFETTGPCVTADGWRCGTARMGVAEWGRPYNRPSGAEGLTPNAWPPWAGWRYQGRGQGGLLAVVNDGCRETYLRVEITGPVFRPIIVNQTTFELLELDLDLAASDRLGLDFRRGQVLLNGSATRYEAITRASTWFACGPGTTFIRYLSRGQVTDSTLTAWWRSAW